MAVITTINTQAVLSGLKEAIDIARDTYCGIKARFHYGFFKSKKLYQESVAEFDEQYISCFMLNTAISMEPNVNMLVTLHDYCKDVGLDKTAEVVKDEIDVRSDVKDFHSLFVARVEALKLYMDFLADEYFDLSGSALIVNPTTYDVMISWPSADYATEFLFSTVE